VDIDADWALGYAGPDIGTLFDNATTTFINPLYCSDCLPENFTTLLVDLGILLYQEFLAFANVPSVFCIPSQVYVEAAILCQKISDDQLYPVLHNSLLYYLKSPL
jgi:hypothetical protein